MAARFYAISREEMHEFLTDLGFLPLALPGVLELVYGKIVRVGEHRLSLRIFTAVNPSGESRAIGTDAIRLQLFMKLRNGDKKDIVPVGHPQKCLRVTTWRDNLLKAIQRHADPEHFRVCAVCGHPMVLRQNQTNGGEFWGCTMFWVTGCKGKRQDAPRPENRLTPTAVV